MAKKTITVDGIAVKIDPRVIEDVRFGQLQTMATKPMPEPVKPDEAGYDEYQREAYEINKAGMDFMDYVLGSEKDKIIKLIRKKNDGFASMDYLGEFVGKIIKQVKAAKK